MWKYPIEDDLIEKFTKYSKTTGVIFIVLGLIGVIYPVFMTYVTVTFVGWVMLFAGLMSGYMTISSKQHDAMGWLKSLALIGASLFILFYPKGGIGTVGLLLSIYFFIDGFSSFNIALSMRPYKNSIIWFINAFFSVLIAMLFLIDWPFSSMYLVGLLVGFSLLFDGIALLAGGTIFKKLLK